MARREIESSGGIKIAQAAAGESLVVHDGENVVAAYDGDGRITTFTPEANTVLVGAPEELAERCVSAGVCLPSDGVSGRVQEALLSAQLRPAPQPLPVKN